jgi:hypothetical protein
MIASTHTLVLVCIHDYDLCHSLYDASISDKADRNLGSDRSQSCQNAALPRLLSDVALKALVKPTSTAGCADW